MRLLWFVNTPSLAAETLTGQPTIEGGWIESLERHMLAQPGIEMAVAFPWRSQEIETFSLNDSTYYGYPQHRPGKWRAYLERLQGRIEPETEVAYFLDIVERFQPDVIHIFGSERAYGLMIPQVQVPTLLWIQGNLTVYSQKWYAGLTQSDVRRHEPWRLRLTGNSWNQTYRRALRVAEREREIFRRCQYFTGRTAWDRRLVATLAPHTTYFHCDEVLREVFYQRAWQGPNHEDEYRLITTIRGNIYKGLETLFEGAKLLQDMLDRPLRWNLFGLEPTHELVRMCVKKTGVSPESVGLSLLGRQPAERLADELAQCHAFVHPSHIDNSPNSVCEAMLMGVPVVSTNVGGIPSLLTNGEEGTLVQNGDPYALAGAIAELLLAPEHAARLGQAARVRAMTRHRPETIVSNLLAIYDAVLNGK